MLSGEYLRGLHVYGSLNKLQLFAVFIGFGLYDIVSSSIDHQENKIPKDVYVDDALGGNTHSLIKYNHS